MDPKLDRNFDKDTDISDEGTSLDQDQTTIEELFLQIRNRVICEKMTEKAVAQTCKFFLHSPKQINIDDRIKLCGLSVRLRPF